MKISRTIKRNIINYFKYYSKKVSIGNGVATTGSILEGKNKIGNDTIFTNSYLGRGSYIGNNGHFNNVRIGRYCSLGQNIKIITGTHPSNHFVSTHPAFFSLSEQAGFTYVNSNKFNEILSLQDINNTSAIIGNDVWLGDDVTILGGLIISDGAIIGSKSLVTKNVDPYSIVGGVPAKHIKTRFSEKEISFLLNTKWWEKEESWIIQNIELFENINNFINLYGKNE